MKSLIKNAARRHGFHVGAVEFLDEVAQTAFCRDLFRETGIDLVIDVGANVGQYRDFIRQSVGYRGQGVSFEPAPQFAAEAELAASHDPRWVVHRMALGSDCRTAPFNVMVGGDFSSFLTPTTGAVDLFAGSNVVAARIEVPVKRLDDVLPRIQREYGSRTPFLKLDTQGFDLEVLRGSTDSLSRIAAIQTELSWIPIYEGMPHAHEVIEFLADFGFRMAGIYRTSRVGWPQVMVETDTYFVATRGFER